MNHFVRSLKLALRYRYTLAGAVVSALFVAVLWGGNIGAVYPLVEISFKASRCPSGPPVESTSSAKNWPTSRPA